MEIIQFADELGPEKVLEVYDPVTGMKGFTVIDNTARGPAKGGIRMTSSVDVHEVFRLARAMTMKNALADLPFGGGKSGIIFRKEDEEKKMDYIRAFARAIKSICPSEYVAAPDVNTSEKEMKVFVEENGNFNSATGKPAEFCQIIHGKKVCGLPHEIGSTGYGISYATKVALKHKKIPLRGARVAIEGFGNVGSFAFLYLEAEGAKIVAISDSKGCLYNSNGIKYEDIKRVKEETGSVINGEGEKLEGTKIFELDTDVLIPAALPDVITSKNKDKVKTRVIIEAANIPIPLAIEEELHEKGILIIPDFVANAGGVISSYVEYIGGSPEFMHKLVQERLTSNTDAVLSTAIKKKISPRKAATEIALSRIARAAEEKKRKHK